MMPNGESRAFAQVLCGCEPTDIAKTVILTPRDETLEALKRRANDIWEFKGFFAASMEKSTIYPSLFSTRRSEAV